MLTPDIHNIMHMPALPPTSLSPGFAFPFASWGDRHTDVPLTGWMPSCRSICAHDAHQCRYCQVFAYVPAYLSIFAVYLSVYKSLGVAAPHTQGPWAGAGEDVRSCASIAARHARSVCARDCLCVYVCVT